MLTLRSLPFDANITQRLSMDQNEAYTEPSVPARGLASASESSALSQMRGTPLPVAVNTTFRPSGDTANQLKSL